MLHKYDYLRGKYKGWKKVYLYVVKMRKGNNAKRINIISKEKCKNLYHHVYSKYELM